MRTKTIFSRKKHYLCEKIVSLCFFSKIHLCRLQNDTNACRVTLALQLVTLTVGDRFALPHAELLQHLKVNTVIPKPLFLSLILLVKKRIVLPIRYMLLTYYYGSE